MRLLKHNTLFLWEPSIGGKKRKSGKQKVFGQKPDPGPLLLPQITHTGMGSNPGLRGDSLSTAGLSQDRVTRKVKQQDPNMTDFCWNRPQCIQETDRDRSWPELPWWWGSDCVWSKWRSCLVTTVHSSNETVYSKVNWSLNWLIGQQFHLNYSVIT